VKYYKVLNSYFEVENDELSTEVAAIISKCHTSLISEEDIAFFNDKLKLTFNQDEYYLLPMKREEISFEEYLNKIKLYTKKYWTNLKKEDDMNQGAFIIGRHLVSSRKSYVRHYLSKKRSDLHEFKDYYLNLTY
jgi:translation elongation factor EF-1beta